MSDSPLSKKQRRDLGDKTPEPATLPNVTPTHSQTSESFLNDENDEDNDVMPSNISYSKSRTPRKLVIGSTDNRFAFSQPLNSNPASSLQVPTLQPPLTQQSRSGRKIKTYSQSPPRSPGRSQGRSPTRKLELIQLSPIKNSRVELQKLYSAHNLKLKKEGRLYINKLVLNDFKSYAGRQVVGPFSTSFSAIVGPNGSGKSNVIDSMLFVFGFRANKMRQDRLADLIHKSEKYPNLPSCSIEVHFQYVNDLPDGSTKIDTEKGDLVITRRAFKNNSSKYYINNKESNYKTVTELLKQEGIDLDHKRFLILQGEVENISQMKAKAEKDNDDGLLEYLEDIIGTTKYKPLIEQNATEMESLNDICIEKENRFEIVDRDKTALEKDKDAALEYLEKEKQLTLARSKRLQVQILESNVKLKNSLEKVSELNSQLEIEKEKFESQQQQISSLVQSHDLMNQELNKLASEEKTINKDKRENKTKEVSLEEMLKSLSHKKRKAEKSLKTTREKIKECETQLRNFGEESIEDEETLQNLNRELEEEKVKLENIKISLKEKTSDISKDITKYENELEPWKVKMQEKTLQIQLMESEISVLQEMQINLENDIANTKSEINLKTQAIDENQKMNENLADEQQVLKKEILVGERECKTAKEKLKDMQIVLNTQRQRATEARFALSSVQNKNKVFAALSRLQKSGRISGFYGRLGDLGIIPKKYDIAISTACPRLDDIVVETVECGQQCIEYLRKNKLGYARFILLDKLRNLNTNPIQTPNDVPRLFDLIQPQQEKFIQAFYSVLRDTLVAKDLNQANNVAYGKRRYRVVTLDGQLIDISGTMSGGGNQVSRGLMKLGDKSTVQMAMCTAEDVQKIETELNEREKNFKVANDTYHEMEMELTRLKDKEPQVELEISKLSLDLDSLKSEIQLLNKSLEQKLTSYAAAQNNNDEVDNAQRKLDDLRKEFSDLESQTKTTQEKLQKLREKIMEIGGINLQLQNSKVTSLLERIDTTQRKLKKKKSEIKKKGNETKKLNKTLESTATDLRTCEAEITKLETQLLETKENISELDNSLEGLLNKKEDMNDKIKDVKEKISEFELDHNQYQSFKLEVENKLEKLTKLVHYVKKEIKEFDKDLNNLAIRDVTQILQQLEEEKSETTSPEKNGISTHGDEVLPEHNPSNNSSNAPTNVIERTEIHIDDIEENEDEEDDKCTEDAMDVDSEQGEISKGIQRLNDAELQNIDKDILDQEIFALDEYLNTTNANIDILEEYVKRLIEYRNRKNDLNSAIQRRDKIGKILEDLKTKRYDEFMEGFSIISMTLKEMYQMITMGGNAELELVDSLDPFSEGVTFSVMPPRKSWRNITNLSGGEKTLSSLALVFALHKYKPTPLYVMDEIDAALDFRNVSIVANYIKESTKNAQFVVISLRNNMFELAQQLVGIYKRDNMTKSVTLQNEDIFEEST
ncbi:similar to Saccharomyces cerevisiae YLR086W SMC4 Subunit of the condensin complex [Maudiozyma saulgeensis]|uniref:Structural maintenance of chromosomes protein n=1 Tax=Maudiozyma saulgeensis TaxID=1789683 RepID=A0A1X7R7L7_9SACH|nr:similar to Saccharomyces cerevisiae YLR086W SMC4 Subunit of the condensin complex [Kazachstania saulgeensis]